MGHPLERRARPSALPAGRGGRRAPHEAALSSAPGRSATPWLVALVAMAVATLAALNVVVNIVGPGTRGQATTDRLAPVVGLPTEPYLLNGSFLVIANTDGIGAYVRRTPKLDDRLDAWPEGTVLRSLGPQISADGIDWKPVSDPAGNEGWIPVQYTAAERR